MKDTKTIVLNAAIAAIYAVLTVMISPIAYGSVQMRISEMMIFLAFYNKKYIPGLVAGCFIANLFSPMLVFDLTFGVGATVLAVIGMYLCGKNNSLMTKLLAAFLGALFNGILVGLELSIAYKIPFLINAFYVFIGELAVLVVGAILFHYLEKNNKFMNLITE